MGFIIFFLMMLFGVMHIISYVLHVKVLKRIKKHNYDLYVEMLDGRPDSFIDRVSPMRQADDGPMLKSLNRAILNGKCDELLPFKSRGLYRSLFWIKVALVSLVVITIVLLYLQTVVFR